jgi:hypothetical protein
VTENRIVEFMKTDMPIKVSGLVEPENAEEKPELSFARQ